MDQIGNTIGQVMKLENFQSFQRGFWGPDYIGPGVRDLRRYGQVRCLGRGRQRGHHLHPSGATGLGQGSCSVQSACAGTTKTPAPVDMWRSCSICRKEWKWRPSSPWATPRRKNPPIRPIPCLTQRSVTSATAASRPLGMDPDGCPPGSGPTETARRL
jgi:hypothetical protein